MSGKRAVLVSVQWYHSLLGRLHGLQHGSSVKVGRHCSCKGSPGAGLAGLHAAVPLGEKERAYRLSVVLQVGGARGTSASAWR